MARFSILKKDLDYISHYFGKIEITLQDDNHFLILQKVFEFYKKSYTLMFPLPFAYGFGLGMTHAFILTDNSELADFFPVVNEIKDLSFLDSSIITELKKDEFKFKYFFSFNALDQELQSLFYRATQFKNPPQLPKEKKMILSLSECLIILEEMFQAIETKNETVSRALVVSKIESSKVSEFLNNEKQRSFELMENIFWRELPVLQKGYWSK